MRTGVYAVLFGRDAGGLPGPDSVPNLELWLEADLGVLTDVDGVYEWDDQSGNSRNVVQATGTKKPSLDAAAQNGLPGILFDGSDDRLAADFGAAIAQPLTVYLACSGFVAGAYIQDGNSGSQRPIISDDTGTGGVQAVINAGTKLSAGATAHSPVLVTAVYNGGSSFVGLNGGDQTASGNSGSSSLYGISLGSTWNELNRYGGHLFAVLWYSAAHDAATQLLVESYLNNKWALY